MVRRQTRESVMQIRIRSGHFEFLRGTWDKESKRTRQKLIKPEDFTPEEKKQYDEYIKEQQDLADAVMCKSAAQTLTSHIESAIKGLELGAYPKQKGGEVYDLIAKLQRALKKAGVARPPKVDKIPETKTGNLDL